MYRYILAKRFPGFGGNFLMKNATILFLTLWMSGCGGGYANLDVPIKPQQQLTTPVEENLLLQIPVGVVRIEPEQGSQLRATLDIYCSSDTGKCAERAANARFVVTQNEGQTIVALTPDRAFNYRKSEPRLVFYVPTIKALSVAMGPGSLNVSNVDSCVDIDMDAGDLKVSADHADVGRVFIDANFGDARLVLPETRVVGSRKLLVGAEVEWDQGPGNCFLKAKLQAGDAEVLLQ